MIQSMTGYGVGRTGNADLQVTAEIKSLNSRNAEVFLRLPHHYFQQEIRLKNHIANKLERGKISMVLSVEVQNPELSMSRVNIHADLIKAYHLELKALQAEMGLNEQVPMSTLLTLPGVVAEQNAEVDEEEWGLVMKAVDQAINSLIQERTKEGAILTRDLNERMKRIRHLAGQVPHYAEGRVEAIRQRITSAFVELGESVTTTEERMQQELIYYLEKYDINEEQVRLAAHLDNFDLTIEEPTSQGRKLQFIVQELWREVNTLGVKSYDLNIQNLVVQMKDELEKMKEQLMNIL